MNAIELHQELKQGFDPNRQCDNVRWNCIDYALCNPDAHPLFEKLLRNSDDASVVELFKKTCQYLGIAATQLSFTDNLDDFENVIVFYWWEQEDRVWGFHYTDYHFLRKTGRIWHGKDGQNSTPEPFPRDQLEFVFNQYDPDQKAIFAIE